MMQKSSSLKNIGSSIVSIIKKKNGASAEIIAEELDVSKAFVIRQLGSLMKSGQYNIQVKGSPVQTYFIESAPKKSKASSKSTSAKTSSAKTSKSKSEPKSEGVNPASAEDFSLAKDIVMHIEKGVLVGEEQIIETFSQKASVDKIKEILDLLTSEGVLSSDLIMNEDMYSVNESSNAKTLREVYKVTIPVAKAPPKQQTSISTGDVLDLCYNAIDKGNRKISAILNYISKKEKGVGRHHVEMAIQNLVAQGRVKEFKANKTTEYVISTPKEEVSFDNIDQVSEVYKLNDVETLTLKAIKNDCSLVTDILSFIEDHGVSTSRHFVDKALTKLLKDMLIKKIAYGKRFQYVLMSQDEIELQEEMQSLDKASAGQTELERKVALFESRVNPARAEHLMARELLDTLISEAIKRL